MPAAHEAWMPLYVADYLGDTTHLNTEQHGAYMLLLMAAWKRGGAVPDDDGQLGQITRMGDRWQAHASAIVRAFFTQRDGMLWHRRVESELAKAKDLVAKKSKAGTAGAAGRWHRNDRRMAEALPGRSQADAPSPSPIPKVDPPTPRRGRGGANGVGRFDEFWLAWPKSERKQDKATCLKHWARNALDSCADAILADVRIKRGTLKWREGYDEAPLVYLRGKRWLDGVVPAGQAADADWRLTRSGIESKGEQLGLGRWDEEASQLGRGEPYPQYEARVLAAASALESA